MTKKLAQLIQFIWSSFLLFMLLKSSWESLTVMGYDGSDFYRQSLTQCLNYIHTTVWEFKDISNFPLYNSEHIYFTRVWVQSYQAAVCFTDSSWFFSASQQRVSLQTSAAWWTLSCHQRNLEYYRNTPPNIRPALYLSFLFLFLGFHARAKIWGSVTLY